MKKVKHKKLIFFIIAILSFICIYNLYTLIVWNFDTVQTLKIVDDINAILNTTEVEEDKTELINPPKEQESDYWYYVKMPLTDINMEALVKQNKEVVGFLNVGGTSINYPIVQAKNNEYYLTHSFDKSYNRAGWVFADYHNNMVSLNYNTVIYAHGRLDQTMFGSLKNIFKNDWLNNKNNYIVRLSTLNENMLFQVFSVYKIKAETYYIQTNFNNPKNYSDWLNKMLKRSQYDFKTQISRTDKILTLSTCYDSSANRIVLHAKLIKKSLR